MSKVAWLISIAQCLLLAGCAPTGNHAPIHGTVLLDGEPLAQGSILFLPIDGTHGTATGTEIKDGRYELGTTTGPAVGTNRVQIQAVRKSGQMIQNPLAPPGQMLEVLVGAIPARFNTASILTVRVGASDNVADFAIESH